jgi:flagellar protein FliJ
MRRSLKTLIRLRDWDVDEKRRAVGELLRVIAEFEERARKLERDLAEDQKVARENPSEAGFLYGYYARAVVDRRRQLAAAKAETEQAIAEAQECLRDAYAELKKYELLQQNRTAAEAAEESRRDRIFLDEIALQSHARKQR